MNNTNQTTISIPGYGTYQVPATKLPDVVALLERLQAINIEQTQATNRPNNPNNGILING